jgi:hypothetical protein
VVTEWELVKQSVQVWRKGLYFLLYGMDINKIRKETNTRTSTTGTQMHGSVRRGLNCYRPSIILIRQSASQWPGVRKKKSPLQEIQLTIFPLTYLQHRQMAVKQNRIHYSSEQGWANTYRELSCNARRTKILRSKSKCRLQICINKKVRPSTADVNNRLTVQHVYSLILWTAFGIIIIRCFKAIFLRACALAKEWDTPPA